MAIDDFDKYLGNLKTYLPDVEDASFSWADVIGLLVIKLRNTDSLNKARLQAMQLRFSLPVKVERLREKERPRTFFLRSH